jgi:hypothetical protein
MLFSMITFLHELGLLISSDIKQKVQEGTPTILLEILLRVQRSQEQVL